MMEKKQTSVKPLIAGVFKPLALLVTRLCRNKYLQMNKTEMM